MPPAHRDAGIREHPERRGALPAGRRRHPLGGALPLAAGRPPARAPSSSRSRSRRSSPGPARSASRCRRPCAASTSPGRCWRRSTAPASASTCSAARRTKSRGAAEAHRRAPARPAHRRRARRLPEAEPTTPIAEINAAKPDVLLVAMGFPRQEQLDRREPPSPRREGRRRRGRLALVHLGRRPPRPALDAPRRPRVAVPPAAPAVAPAPPASAAAVRLAGLPRAAARCG